MPNEIARNAETFIFYYAIVACRVAIATAPVQIEEICSTMPKNLTAFFPGLIPTDLKDR